MTTEQTQAQPETRPSEVRSDALLAKLRVYEDALQEIASKRVYDGWIDRIDQYKSGYADARRRDVKTAKDALANAPGEGRGIPRTLDPIVGSSSEGTE